MADQPNLTHIAKNLALLQTLLLCR